MILSNKNVLKFKWIFVNEFIAHVQFIEMYHSKIIELYNYKKELQQHVKIDILFN